MSTLLVTGAAGFIGANFVHYWLRTHAADRVIGYDALTYAGNLANLESVFANERFRFVKGDICDGDAVAALLEAERVGTLVHFAAEAHVDRSILGPDEFIRTNVLGTHSLLKAARAAWLPQRQARHRFHHVSTDEVYGSLGWEDAPFEETDTYAPSSPYSASKAGSDHLVRAYHHTYGLDVTISNCSNNYGPYHYPDKLVPLAIVNILQGRPLPIYGDGRNVRDWLHVSDHCRAVELVLERGLPGEMYNVGGRSGISNVELVGKLCGIADSAFAMRPELAGRFPDAPPARGASTRELITFVKDRPGHDRRYAVSAGKIERELGFRPALSLEQGLRDTFDWYLANEPWWRHVMDDSYQSWIATHYGTVAPV